MIIFLLSHTPCSHEYDVDDAGDADDAGDDEDDDDGVDIDEDENDTNDAWVMQARKSDDPLPSSFPFSRSQPSFPAAAPINYHTDAIDDDDDDDDEDDGDDSDDEADDDDSDDNALVNTRSAAVLWPLDPESQLPGSQQHCISALCFCVFVLCICVKHNVYFS